MGVVPKNEDYQRYCSVSSHGLLCYYAMRQEEEEDDAIWEALIVQGGLFFRKCLYTEDRGCVFRIWQDSGGF